MEEEFNNFMHRVTEISGIVRKLTADDKELNEIGKLEADKYLASGGDGNYTETADGYKFKYDKTVINRTEGSNEEKSKDAFMKEVERDAKQRFEDRQVRKERAGIFKVQANKAFRRGEYEKSITLYTKALGETNDSCVLYTNRALAYVKVGRGDMAAVDCGTALKLNERSTKAWLLLMKAHALMEDLPALHRCATDCLEVNPHLKTIVDDFVKNPKSLFE